MIETFKNFVGGQWKASKTGKTFENANPASKGSNLGFFQSSGADDIDEWVVSRNRVNRLCRINVHAQHLPEQSRLVLSVAARFDVSRRSRRRSRILIVPVTAVAGSYI